MPMFTNESSELKMFKNLRPECLGMWAIRESEKIELALTYGFRGIDLDIPEFQKRVQNYDLDHARRLVDSADVRLGTFVLPLDLAADDDAFNDALARLPELAQTAADVGCTRCRTVIEPATDQKPYHEYFEQHRDRLGKIAEVLEPIGVRLGLRFQGPPKLRQDKSFEFIHDLEALKVLVDSVGSPSVGVTLDLWDLYASGGKVADIEKLKIEQIVSVDVADVDSTVPLDGLDERDRKLPGLTGVIDTSAALVTLAQGGYEGPVTPVPHPSCFDGMTRENIIRDAGEALDRVWKAASLSPLGRVVEPEPVEAEPAEGESAEGQGEGEAESVESAQAK